MLIPTFGRPGAIGLRKQLAQQGRCRMQSSQILQYPEVAVASVMAEAVHPPRVLLNGNSSVRANSVPGAGRLLKWKNLLSGVELTSI